MAKIRVHDLARMMQIPEQDLVFKLRSLGVRVEGDDAGIEAEALQAILQGKRLASPREVIMDDGPAPAPPPSRGTGGEGAGATGRRQSVNPLRPSRPRTIIQKVEPRILTLPTTQPDRSAPTGGPVAGGARSHRDAHRRALRHRGVALRALAPGGAPRLGRQVPRHDGSAQGQGRVRPVYLQE